jgi:hypothetical protein
MPSSAARANALDHVEAVLFENRSLDNVLGRLYNEEYRHTSLIATLRKAWDLGPAFTQRNASARTFDHIFTRNTLRDPQTWATFQAQPEPAWTIDYVALGKALGYLGKDVAPGHHRARPADGNQAPAAASRPLRRTHPAAPRRSHPGRRLPLLPPAGAR